MHPSNRMNDLKPLVRRWSKHRMKQFAENLRGRDISRPIVPNHDGCTFLPADGISGQADPHLTNLKAKNGVAHLDRLSVRCLSSYLSFALIFGDTYASRFAGATRGAVCAPFLLPLPEIGKRHRGKPEELSEIESPSVGKDLFANPHLRGHHAVDAARRRCSDPWFECGETPGQ
jgi:hypothetical protein